MTLWNECFQHRKRLTSPSQSKNHAGKKKPRKAVETKDKDVEDEMSSQSDEYTPEPPPVKVFMSQLSANSVDSSLATTSFRSVDYDIGV